LKLRRRLGFQMSLVLVIMVLMPAWTVAAQEGGPRAREATLAQGRWVYEANCAICHGVLGDGRGMAAHMFSTRPRDFTKGLFKFRSTPSGSLPTDDDLTRTISGGLGGTPMVPQPRLTRQELDAVVTYIKIFSERFQRETRASAIAIPEPPASDEGLVLRGREMYIEAGCDSCHGPNGRGDGLSAGDLVDAWGYAISPGDLTTPAKRGSSASAIYRTLVTGLDGTPMPSYQGALNEEQLWALAFYVASLNKGSLSFRQRQEELRGQHVLRMHGPHGGMMHRGPPWRR